jgi:hypothetical protein
VNYLIALARIRHRPRWADKYAGLLPAYEHLVALGWAVGTPADGGTEYRITEDGKLAFDYSAKPDVR